MIRLTSKLQEHRSRNATPIEVVRYTRFKPLRIADNIVAKVMRKYFEIVKRNLLNGYEYEFPFKNGSAFIGKVEKDTNRTIKLNSRYKYMVIWESEEIVKRGMKFMAGETFMKEILEEIKNKNLDFRYYGG